MRKSLIFIIAVVVTAATLFFTFNFSGCTASLDEESASQLKNDVYDIYEELKPIYLDSKDIYEVRDHMYEWGKEHGFSVSKLAGGNLVITKHPSRNKKDSPETVFQCTMSQDNYKEHCQTAAIALAAMKNASIHGQVSLILTADIEGKHTGAKMLSRSYLNTDYFMNLEYSPETAVYTGSAATAEYSMSCPLTKSETAADKAYEITITGLSCVDSSDCSKKHPNPIVTIADLLTNCKSGGLIIELAEFNGGTSACKFPSSATAVIVVDQSSETKFLKKLEKCQDDFTDDYYNDQPNMDFEFKEVQVPSKVISEKYTSNILSLMYTTVNGTYSTTEEDGEGDPTALANKGSISTKEDFELSMCVRAADNGLLEEMDESYRKSAELSDMKFAIKDETPCWPFSDGGDFYKVLSSAGSQGGLDMPEPSSTFKKSECAVFYKKKNDINMISFGVNNGSSFEQSKTLVYFLSFICLEK